MTTKIFAPNEWLARRAAHETRVAPWIEPRLARKSLGERHPVDDFLFEYYSYRPAHLRRWHPGIGATLLGEPAAEFLTHPHYRHDDDGVCVSVDNLRPARFTFVRWLVAMLEAVRDRPPFFGCAGLHEWAMVYRAEEVRHPRWSFVSAMRKPLASSRAFPCVAATSTRFASSRPGPDP